MKIQIENLKEGRDYYLAFLLSQPGVKRILNAFEAEPEDEAMFERLKGSCTIEDWELTDELIRTAQLCHGQDPDYQLHDKLQQVKKKLKGPSQRKKREVK